MRKIIDGLIFVAAVVGGYAYFAWQPSDETPSAQSQASRSGGGRRPGGNRSVIVTTIEVRAV